jgi:subtilisin family serine protease
MRKVQYSLMVVASLAAGLGSLTAQAAEPGQGQQAGPAGTNARPAVVAESFTLLTGDRVVWQSPDDTAPRITPARGREDVPFITRRFDKHVYVFPSDVLSLVASGKLDRRLFDLTTLHEFGYDDAHSSRLPVLVTYTSASVLAAGRAKLAAVGVRQRALPSVRGAAVTVAKRGASTFWSALGATDPRTRTVGAGIRKVWLDGFIQPVLDQSVPQIGAPAAWAAGLTGKGVPIAVVDTGIDAKHPDLTDKVLDAANFTSELEGDHVGHGTHVASIIAGTGAASGGRYKGVAPEADLYDAKACVNVRGQGRCANSSVIAAMEWAAVTKHAKVVNLSLGGPDLPGVDPVEEAVNTLTAQTGALFVIAAGNSGAERSVASPGSADAALTVGAVDKQDNLAEFSSRGPRIGDSALKPDVTAPGVDIVAARAGGTEAGGPVGDWYVMLSGTSMATPHVAAAAAILTQQHPDWPAERLKATLMTSAKSISGQSLFEQGAGRIDVAKAITQPVISEPGSLSYGFQRWPHTGNEPIVKQVTYRNLGTEPVTLSLSTSLGGPDGQPVASDVLTLGQTTIVVPANGTADVSVTVDVRHLATRGLYAGAVLATAGDVTVRTPLGFEIEGESYDLTVRALDHNGTAARYFTGWLVGVDKTYESLLYAPVTQLRLPKGRYLLDAQITTTADETPDGVPAWAFLVQPLIELNHDTTITVDARTAQPMDVSLPRTTAELATAQIGYLRSGATGVVYRSSVTFNDSLRMGTAQLGPRVPAADMTTYVDGQWAQANSLSEPWLKFNNTPYIYALMWKTKGAFVTGFHRSVRQSELATVTSVHRANGAGSLGQWILYGILDGNRSASALYPFTFDLPATVTVYLGGGDHVVWRSIVTELARPTAPAPYPEAVNVLLGGPSTYRANRHYRETWNTPVLGPAFPREARSTYFEGETLPWLARSNDLITVRIPLLSDRGGHAGVGNLWHWVGGDTKLFRNGELTAEWGEAGYLDAEVTPEPATYRLETSVQRPPTAGVSTDVKATWTFRSGHADGAVTLPLSTIQFAPPVDLDNRVRWRPRYVVPVTVQRQAGSAAGQVKTLSVDVSTDDGQSWIPARLIRGSQGQRLAVVRTPAAAYVSIRAHSTDTLGNTVEQTITRAYELE